MSNYKIQPLVESGFDFSTIFPEKQKTLQEFGGFNFGIQEIVDLLKTQTDNFTISNDVALDIDKYIYEAYEKQTSLNAPEEKPVEIIEPIEKPKEEKKKTVEDYEKLIKGYGIKLKGAKTDEEKKWIGKKVKGYEIKIKNLKSKKEKGGELIISTTHTFGDPKENTDPKIDMVFSEQDPKKENGGTLASSVSLRNIQSGSVSNWDLKEVVDMINESGEGTGVVYDEKNWLDGFNSIEDNYSLLDIDGNPLNDFSNYASGGGVEKEWIVEVASDSNRKTIRIKAGGESEAIDYAFRELSEQGENSDEYHVESAYKAYAKGGGFEKLAKHVAKEYEGHKVAPEYQKEYGKKYSHEEAVEVGKKVAAKVYRQQLSNK